MKTNPPKTAPIGRRNWVIGVGAAGAAAVAVKALPGAAVATAPVSTALAPAADAAGGYQLTAHVLRYYQTARG